MIVSDEVRINHIFGFLSLQCRFSAFGSAFQ